MSVNNQKNNEEEVDLGSLFIIIGKGFSNFFNFIGNIFKGIFHAIILVLLFLKKNFVKIGIAAILGGIIGFFLESKKEAVYTADLLVVPNFSSSRQLYSNIEYYNELAKQKDTAAIQQVFNLDKKTAGSLKELTIKPVKNEYSIIKSYNDLLLSVDTLSRKVIDYKIFESSFSDYDYHLHKINVVSGEEDVFSALEKVIISTITENEYFKRKKEVDNRNLDRLDSLFRKDLNRIDVLQKAYVQVMLEEAKKQSTTGTNIDLGRGGIESSKEIELLNKNKEVSENLTEIVKTKVDREKIMNVISSFPSRGIRVKGVTENYSFLLAGFGVVLVIFSLLAIQLNRYLENYQKKK